MSNIFYKEAIALAALFQSASLVEQIADGGTVDDESFAACINSVYKLNSASIEAVYDGQVNYIPSLQLGFKQLLKMNDGAANSPSNILRYVMGMLFLQKKLSKRKDLLDILGQRLQQITDKLNHFEPTHEVMLSNLSSAYEDTLSTLSHRIHVHGQRHYLENPVNVTKIRALLLAGIRAAMLWQQVGGKRWHLLFKRKQISEEVSKLI